MGQTVIISTALSEKIRRLYFRIVPPPVQHQHRFASWDEIISLLFEHLQYQENARIAYLNAMEKEIDSYLNNPANHDACMNAGLVNAMQKNLLVKIRNNLFPKEEFNDIAEPQSEIQADKSKG